MYVLILTVVLSYSSAVTRVPGFASAKLCQDAGDLWLRQVQGNERANIAVIAICARQS